MPTYKYNTGDRVTARGIWHSDPEQDGLVLGIGEECGYPVADLILDNGQRVWRYFTQLTLIESHAGKVERQLREMMAVLR